MTTGNWHRVKTDGHPPCDSETIFVGINSSGYCGCFNATTPSIEQKQEINCWYETAEDTARVMEDLLWWKLLEMPS